MAMQALSRFAPIEGCKDVVGEALGSVVWRRRWKFSTGAFDNFFEGGGVDEEKCCIFTFGKVYCQCGVIVLLSKI
jgi:hypothetical protein